VTLDRPSAKLGYDSLQVMISYSPESQKAHPRWHHIPYFTRHDIIISEMFEMDVMTFKVHSRLLVIAF